MGLLNKIWVKISGDSTELESTLKKTHGSVTVWASKIAGLMGIAFGVKALIDFSKEAARMAAEVEGIKSAYTKLGGESKKVLEDMKRATRGTIQEDELMRLAVRAQSLGIPMKDISTYLEFATNQAIRLNKPIQEMADLMINSVGRGSSRGLYQLGIATNVANKAFKETGGMVKLVSSMLGEMGTVADTTMTKMQKLATSGAEFKEAWGAWLNKSKAIGAVRTYFTEILKAWADESRNFWQKAAMLLPYYGGQMNENTIWNNAQKQQQKEEQENSKEMLSPDHYKGVMAYMNQHPEESKKAAITLNTLNEKLKEMKADYDDLDISQTKARESKMADITALEHEIELLTKKATLLEKVAIDQLKLPQNNITGSVFDKKTFGVGTSVTNKLAGAPNAGSLGMYAGINMDKANMDAMSAAIDKQAALDAAEAKVEEWNKNMMNVLQGAKADLAGAAADMVESLFEAMGSGNWSDFGKSLLMGFASFLSSIGKQLIALAIVEGALANVLKNPAAWPIALAAGVAAVAIAGAIKGSLSGGMSSITSGGGGGMSSSQGSLQNMKIIVEGKIRGKDIEITNRRYAEDN